MDRILSYLLPQRGLDRSTNPNGFWGIFSDDRIVDTLEEYTLEWFSVFLDVITEEWYRFRVPNTPAFVSSPPGVHGLFRLDRGEARKLQNDIRNCHYDPRHTKRRMTFFAGYGMHVPDEYRIEELGMNFLARQADYLLDYDHYIVVVGIVRDPFGMLDGLPEA
jgi:hypothetical protein